MERMLSNMHTHTLFSDGRNSPEDFVEEALESGFLSIGFSDHGYTSFDETYCMKKDALTEYCQEISRLKKKYEGQIEIFCGIEQDYYSDLKVPESIDFVIGSVHYMKIGGQYHGLDITPEGEGSLSLLVEKHFSGDWFHFCEKYYELLIKMPSKTGCQIAAHPDLITKFNGDRKYFDENDPRYREPALNAVRSLVKSGVLIEINLGAMNRGLRSEPYPARFMLEEVAKLGGEIIISTDAHGTENLCSSFQCATEIARKCGFEHSKILRKTGFQDISLL